MVTSGFNMTLTLHSTDTRLATAIYLTLMAILGTLGNILVIVSIVRMKKFSRLYYLLIANLNIVALVTSVCLIPSHIVNIINSGLAHSNTELCKVLGYLNFTLTLEVLLNTSAIAIERCMVVHQTTQNLFHHRSNKRKNTMLIIFLWTVPAVVSISGFPFIGYHPFMLDCFFVVSRDSFWYILFALSSPAVVSMLIIFVSYFLTLKKVRDSYRKVAALVSNQNNKDVNVDCVPPSTNKNFMDNTLHRTNKHSETNPSFNRQKHESITDMRPCSEVASKNVPSSTKTKCYSTTKPSEGNTSIYIFQHPTATDSKQAEPASTKVPTLATINVADNCGYHTTKPLEAETSTHTAGYDSDMTIHSETISREISTRRRKHGTSKYLEGTGKKSSYKVTSSEIHTTTRKHDTSEDNTNFQAHAPSHKCDKAVPSKTQQTVPVIGLRPADEESQESPLDSTQSNCSPDIFVDHSPQELIRDNDFGITQTLPNPNFHHLSTPSTDKVQQPCNHDNTKEAATVANLSVMKKTLNLEFSKNLLRSNTMFVSEKNITKKAMSLTNKDKPSAIHKHHLNINNTGSVPSISSIISETNMEDREVKKEESTTMTRTAAAGKYNKQMRKELSLTVHLFPVFVIFCFMYLPICVIQAIHVYYPVSPNVWLTFSTLELSFSTLSWVLYGVLNREFRRAYRNILCCQ